MITYLHAINLIHVFFKDCSIRATCGYLVRSECFIRVFATTYLLKVTCPVYRNARIMEAQIMKVWL